MKYLVCTRCGGLMESPEIYFSGPSNIIEADSEEEARKIYDKKNNCSYFYGSVLGHEENGSFILTNDFISKYKFDMFLNLAQNEKNI